MAVYECIRLSQAHNDADCLEHALVCHAVCLPHQCRVLRLAICNC